MPNRVNVSVAPPQEAIGKLQKIYTQLALDFVLASEDIYYFDLENAQSRTAQVHQRAVEFQKEATETLQKLRLDFICCSAKHVPPPPPTLSVKYMFIPAVIVVVPLLVVVSKKTNFLTPGPVRRRFTQRSS
eukprot:TRINITY_DN19603_c0_g1::TRINITY_DN19603_c0_g1_i1::g.24494::m.24494 TRINITY_DN19603_c0_g1::TRINITY_DN19603_c0_g1_i1::g.24494  ORF type:complete len:131 (-),score=18.57,DUF3907/PF13047.1/0.068,Synaptobrevin/PF00957.16/7.7 TRINITY_DN19603_c0_g1_i1:13-405(-)